MLLSRVKPGHVGKIKSVLGNEKNKKFLFTLGCSEGEEIALISILAGNYIVSIKDVRYAIDKCIATSIEIA